MRRAFAALAVVFVGCTSSSAAQPSTSSPVPATSTSSPTSSPTSSVSISPSPSVKPVKLPRGTPKSYRPDDAPGDVPPASLVPSDATVAGTWFADTSSGATILVAFGRGIDMFASEQALLVWRRFDTNPHWRPVLAVDEPASQGVLGITVTLGDATGDRSLDALAFESTGGSGGCGTWRLLDLAAATDVWDLVAACDTQVAFSSHPAGLQMTEAVFKPGDAHCCPSRFRISQLAFDGSTMKVTSRRTEKAPIAP